MSVRTALFLLLCEAVTASAGEEGRIQDVIVPTTDRAQCEVLAFSIASPQGGEWKLRQLNAEMSRVAFVHASGEAVLVAKWQPIFKCDRDIDVRRLTEWMWRIEAVEPLNLSTNYTVISADPESTEAVGNRMFRKERVRLTSTSERTKKPFQFDCHTLILETGATDDRFILFLATSTRSESRKNINLDAFRALAASFDPACNVPPQIAQVRTTIALRRYTQLADTITVTGEVARLDCARRDATAEATLASVALPHSARPWVALARLAEYNAAHRRYGEGFDSRHAEECYREALRRRLSSYAAHVGLAELYEITGRESEAELEWQAAIETQPSDGELYYQLGKLYEKSSRPTDALASYRQALRFWRGEAQIRKQLEQIIAALGKQAP